MEMPFNLAFGHRFRQAVLAKVCTDFKVDLFSFFPLKLKVKA